MQLEKYTLRSETSQTYFEFISEGQKGSIRKVIQFQLTNNPSIYNLAFGDKSNLGDEIDDLAVSNNGDTGKILATVAEAVLAFLESHQQAFVYATGSTKARTRLYRMGISKHYHEISRELLIYGQVEDEFYEFEIGGDYSGFLAQLKFD